MMWNDYNRPIQQNLEQLRTDSYKIMSFVTGIIAWLWFSWYILPNKHNAAFGSNLWIPGAFILGVIILSRLFRKYQALAGDIFFIGGLLTTITLSLSFSKTPSLVLLYFVPILFASVLFSRMGLIIVAGLTSAILLSVSILFAELSISNIVVPLLTLGMSTSAVWVSTYNLQEALAWTLNGYQHARKNELLVRDQKSILEDTLERLDATIEQLQLSNAMLTEARNKAVEAQRLKQQFAQTISHELRTPLNLIVGFTETMIKSPEYYGNPLSPEYLRDLSVVYRNATHLQNLVNDVLDLARLEKASIMLVAEPLQVENVINDAANTVRGLVNKQGLNLVVDIESELPMISGDAVRLKQILLNLLNNAVRFTEEGQITLKAVAQENDVSICVEDTGTGIPYDRQNAIFEPFLQLENPMQRRRNGAGLGLAISKHLVELHGGNIYVRSQPGQGSKFYFNIPIYIPETLEVERLLKTEADSATQEEVSNRIPLLVVTKNSSAATLLSQTLGNYRPIIVSDIHQITSVAQKMMLHQVVIDTNSAYFSEEQRERLMWSPELKDVRIIFCPLPNEDSLRQQFDADGFVVKPVSQQSIQDMLQQVDPNYEQILIVDDNRDFVRLMDRLVSSSAQHVQIMHAFSGSQAIALTQEHQFDLVLMDINLPDIEGIQLVGDIRRLSPNDKLKIIIVSAYDIELAATPLPGELSVWKSTGLFPNEILKFIQVVV